MDSTLKNNSLKPENIIKEKDCDHHWEYQRKMWKNQRESLFSLLFDEKIIDTTSNIGLKENKADKLIKNQSLEQKVKIEKSSSTITKKEIDPPIKSSIETKTFFLNYKKEHKDPKEFYEYIDNYKPQPNLPEKLLFNDTVKQDSLLSIQKADIKDSLKFPLHKISGIDMGSCVSDSLLNKNYILKNEITENKIYSRSPSAIVTCCVCDQQVCKSELSYHLFFGPLSCDICQIKIIDCKSFNSTLYIASNCNHNQLSWLQDPIRYLKSTLNEAPECEKNSIYNYFTCLKTLEQLNPWNIAFQDYYMFEKITSFQNKKSELVQNKCKDVINDDIDIKCEEVLLFESYDIDQMERDTQVIGLLDHDMFEENFTEDLTLVKSFNESPSVKLEENESAKSMFYFEKNIEKGNDNCDSELVCLENKTSYKNKLSNKVDNTDQISKKAKYLKSICYDKIKRKNYWVSKSTKTFIESSCLNIVDDKIKASLSNDYQIDFLSLPKDGNYLVSRIPIEECPMCYSVLNLYKCVVNIKLLLYTFKCDCGLKIFYMPKTPDNIDHPVKIIEF